MASEGSIKKRITPFKRLIKLPFHGFIVVFFSAFVSFAQAEENQKSESLTIPTIGNPYTNHAALAAFSISSLAIGGLFYFLQNSQPNENSGFVQTDHAPIQTAIGAAGFSALIAGGAYFYYAHRDIEKRHEWDAQLSGGLNPKGGVNLFAALNF